MATTDKKKKKDLARPTSRYGAATTRNNNSGKGLSAYGGVAMPQEQKDGKGLRVYIPRKRKPKVAVPRKSRPGSYNDQGPHKGMLDKGKYIGIETGYGLTVIERGNHPYRTKKMKKGDNPKRRFFKGKG